MLKQGLDRRLLFYLLENRESFPGVSVERTYVREYKDGSLAAHVLGLRRPDQPSSAEAGPHTGACGPATSSASPASSTATTSSCAAPPAASGSRSTPWDGPRGELGNRPAQAGDNLRLTLDSGLQETGEAALRAKGLPSAFVAMNVHSGAILAMGSYPTYDPSFYTQPHTKAQYDAFGNRAGDPLVDRADQGGYPTGSAFKPITATAALEDGLISPGTIFNDTGSLDIGGLVVHNAGGAANGPIDMSTALKVSSDVYFFSLGLHASASGKGGQIQDWAHAFGLGQKPDVDLPDASAGLIPTPAWRNRVYRSHKNPYIDRPWNQGDNVNLAVGQGDVHGHAAAARPGLCGARQRWHARHAARRGPDRRRARQDRRADQAAAEEPSAHLGGDPERDPRRARASGDGAGRHLLSGDGWLPVRGRGQDRAPPSAGRAPRTSRGTA